MDGYHGKGSSVSHARAVPLEKGTEVKMQWVVESKILKGQRAD